MISGIVEGCNGMPQYVDGRWQVSNFRRGGRVYVHGAVTGEAAYSAV